MPNSNHNEINCNSNPHEKENKKKEEFLKAYLHFRENPNKYAYARKESDLNSSYLSPKNLPLVNSGVSSIKDVELIRIKNSQEDKEDYFLGKGTEGKVKCCERAIIKTFSWRPSTISDVFIDEQEYVIKSQPIINNQSFLEKEAQINNDLFEAGITPLIIRKKTPIDKAYQVLHHKGAKLTNLIPTLFKEERLAITIDILLCLDGYHSGNASKTKTPRAHADVKPDNVTRDTRNQIHLVDHGLTTENLNLVPNYGDTVLGTPCYLPIPTEKFLKKNFPSGKSKFDHLVNVTYRERDIVAWKKTVFIGNQFPWKDPKGYPLSIYNETTFLELPEEIRNLLKTETEKDLQNNYEARVYAAILITFKNNGHISKEEIKSLISKEKKVTKIIEDYLKSKNNSTIDQQGITEKEHGTNHAWYNRFFNRATLTNTTTSSAILPTIKPQTETISVTEKKTSSKKQLSHYGAKFYYNKTLVPPIKIPTQSSADVISPRQLRTSLSLDSARSVISTQKNQTPRKENGQVSPKKEKKSSGCSPRITPRLFRKQDDDPPPNKCTKMAP